MRAGINSINMLNKNKKIPLPFNIEEASDGYHTFKELYEHRITLYIALCKQICLWNESNPLNVWRSKKHSDGELAFGGTWFVLGINKEKGEQITYHLPIEKWNETNFAETLDIAPEFDGHTAENVLNRIKRM